MIKNIKSCIIVYGWIDDFDKLINVYKNEYIILIESRKQYLDIIQDKIKGKNIILIKKILGDNKISETFLYYNKLKDLYLIETENKLQLPRQNIYQTTISNIISTYNIQNIKSFVINININNLDNVFNNLIPFNHIISKIQFKSNIEYIPKTNFFDNFDEKSSFDEQSNIENTYNRYFYHKNLNIPLPNIVMYFSNSNYLQHNIDKLKLLVNQYQINIIYNTNECNNKCNIIPYSDDLQAINNLKTITESKQNSIVSNIIYHEKIINNLETIFTSNLEFDKFDIIIQFSPKFLNNNILQIMYPLKDNVLYINKVFDIIYATKNCMYMLYQILKSKYFTDYIEEKHAVKPSLFKFFSKKYFFEYISKIFIVREF